MQTEKKKKKKDLLSKWIFHITISLKYFIQSDTFNNINEKHYKVHSCQLENDLTTNLVVMSPEFITGKVFLEVVQNSLLAVSQPDYQDNIKYLIYFTRVTIGSLPTDNME